MSVVVSHPTGNANVRAVLRALARDDRLDGFWTALALPPRLAGSPLLGRRLSRELGRRSFPEVPWRRTHVRPLRETTRLLGRRLGLRALTRHEHGWASVDAVYRHLDEAVAHYLTRRGRDGVRAVYAYDDGALASFKAARARGITCIYDLPIAHWRTLRRLLQEEAAMHPEWAGTMEGLTDSPAKLARKDEEIALADRILVPSSFVRSSVIQGASASTTIEVLSWGAPSAINAPTASHRPGEPINVLFAGTLTQRKGVKYLIDAFRRLSIPWNLTVAGQSAGEIPNELKDFLDDPRCRWLGHIPHQSLLEEMRRSHVFLLPSIVEGMALVLTEAMAQGLPIIATPNSGATDIVTDRETGFIIPIRDPDIIAQRLTELYEDEDRRDAMAEAALTRATAASWRRYEDRVARLFDEILA